jgi:hypothetical protein
MVVAAVTESSYPNVTVPVPPYIVAKFCQKALRVIASFLRADIVILSVWQILP